jgi:hypothetical protein
VIKMLDNFHWKYINKPQWVKTWTDRTNSMDKLIMTRAEAISSLEKYCPTASNASAIIDFYIAAGMLEVKEEEKHVKVLFSSTSIDGGIIRLETWPEGLVLWVNGKIKYKWWEDTGK